MDAIEYNPIAVQADGMSFVSYNVCPDPWKHDARRTPALQIAHGIQLSAVMSNRFCDPEDCVTLSRLMGVNPVSLWVSHEQALTVRARFQAKIGRRYSKISYYETNKTNPRRQSHIANQICRNPIFVDSDRNCRCLCTQQLVSE